MRGKQAAFADYSQYSDLQLMDAFEAAPARIREVLSGLTEPDLRVRARGDKTWSCQEIVMHLTDSETQGAFRIRKAWSESGCDLPGFNESLWTSKLNHQDASAAERESSFLTFSALRRSTAPLFRRATPADFTDRFGIHPEYGAITLRNLLELYADHGERHIDQILGIRRLLGKPLQCALLLPVRLY
jgi:DinB superfamily